MCCTILTDISDTIQKANSGRARCRQVYHNTVRASRTGDGRASLGGDLPHGRLLPAAPAALYLLELQPGLASGAPRPRPAAQLRIHVSKVRVARKWKQQRVGGQVFQLISNDKTCCSMLLLLTTCNCVTAWWARGVRAVWWLAGWRRPVTQCCWWRRAAPPPASLTSPPWWASCRTPPSTGPSGRRCRSALLSQQAASVAGPVARPVTETTMIRSSA